MTEQDWLTNRAGGLLAYAIDLPNLYGVPLPRAGLMRRVRLFCCACCRRVAGVLAGPGDREGLRLAEELAEQPEDFRPDGELPAASGPVYAALRGYATAAAHGSLALLGGPGQAEESAAQADLIREIFGNPFRPAPGLDPAWLAWGGGTPPALALVIYEERAFDRLPVLADALEDAGCTSAELLEHLRGSGPHVRGCWALVAVLGKGPLGRRGGS
jgi:hypothetical protein